MTHAQTAKTVRQPTRPSQPSASYAPDQTVGSYIRRMAQETVIHRIDAELATRQPVAAVPDDLAIDGIDELLKVFVAYSVAEWSNYFTDILAKSPGRTCTVHAGPPTMIGSLDFWVTTARGLLRPGSCIS